MYRLRSFFQSFAFPPELRGGVYSNNYCITLSISFPVDCSAITLCAHQTSVIVFFRYGCKIKIINGGAGEYLGLGRSNFLYILGYSVPN